MVTFLVKMHALALSPILFKLMVYKKAPYLRDSV
jgi:hypothetical protein